MQNIINMYYNKGDPIMHNTKMNGLQIARESRKLSRAQLASKLKVSSTVIKGWEEAGAGVIPFPILIKLSKILGVSIEMLAYADIRVPLNVSRLDEKQLNCVLNFYNNFNE